MLLRYITMTIALMVICCFSAHAQTKKVIGYGTKAATVCTVNCTTTPPVTDTCQNPAATAPQPTGVSASDWKLVFCDNFLGTPASMNNTTGLDEGKWDYLFHAKPNSGQACAWNTFVANPSQSQAAPGTIVNIAAAEPKAQMYGQPGVYSLTSSPYHIDVGYFVTDITHPTYIQAGTKITAVGPRSGASTFTMSNASKTAIPLTDILRFTSPGTQGLIVGPVTLNGVTSNMLTFNFTAETTTCGDTTAPTPQYASGTYGITGAIISSRTHFLPLYGFQEVSMRTGVVKSVGTDSNGNPIYPGGRDEGMIMYAPTEDGLSEYDPGETLTTNPQTTSFTVHWGISNPDQKASEPGNMTLSSGTFNSAFHIIGLDWEPTFVKMYVDGALYYSITKSADNSTYTLTGPSGTNGTSFQHGARTATNAYPNADAYGTLGPVANKALEWMFVPDTCAVTNTYNNWCYTPTADKNILYPYKMYLHYMRYWQHAGQTYTQGN